LQTSMRPAFRVWLPRHSPRSPRSLFIEHGYDQNRGPLGIGATGGLRALSGVVEPSDSSGGQEGYSENSSNSVKTQTLLALAAAGLLAGWILPLPFWAKAVSELVVGIVFRVQIWRLCTPLRTGVSAACQKALNKFNSNRRAALLIPLVAALVGWITNWLAVQMIFYPIGYWGVPIKRWVISSLYNCEILQPLGILGWQGIVPAKAAQMAYSMVEMVTSQLIDVGEVFSRLDPGAIAKLLRPEMPQLGLEAGRDMLPSLYTGLAESRVPGLPGFMKSFATGLQDDYVKGLVEALKHNIDYCVDLKELVVTNMCDDRNVIVRLFQKCGSEELKFLVESGLYFGFLLGIIQMFIWLFVDSPWTLTVGGAAVGYITNWLALKCIFEPLYPVNWGPFVFQGIFLKRQYQVSCEFANFLASEVLTSAKMWGNMLFGLRTPEFQQVVRDHTTRFVERLQPGVARDGAAGFINEAAALQALRIMIY